MKTCIFGIFFNFQIPIKQNYVNKSPQKLRIGTYSRCTKDVQKFILKESDEVICIGPLQRGMTQ